VALSAPALWDRIHSCLDDSWGPTQATPEAVITTWFGRAGARPLSLEFSDGCIPGNPPMCSVIRRHASQLQSLQLTYIEENDRDTFISALADILQPFPLLRDLSLRYPVITLQPARTAIPVFSGAPLLRSLYLQNIPPSALKMPWAQLTQFTAHKISRQECLEVLQLATALQEFRRNWRGRRSISRAYTPSLPSQLKLAQS
jgi:hypothetical protein